MGYFAIKSSHFSSFFFFSFFSIIVHRFEQRNFMRALIYIYTGIFQHGVLKIYVYLNLVL